MGSQGIPHCLLSRGGMYYVFFSDFRGFVRQLFIFLLCLEKRFDFDLPLSFDLYCAVLFSFFCFRFIAFMEQQGIEGDMEMANLNDTVMVSDF